LTQDVQCLSKGTLEEETNYDVAAFGPDFIGVGPEKTGTSWIYEQLLSHDTVSMPKLKELRYFWEDQNYHCENPLSRLANFSGWHRVRYREELMRLAKRALKNPVQTFSDLDDLKWNLSYIFCKHDDEWYLKNFQHEHGYLSGEISPQYFFLKRQQIERIQKILPEAKIIITLRHPEDWMSSFIKMGIRIGTFQKRYKGVEDFVQKKYGGSSLSEGCQEWISAFGSDRVGVFFYDDLLNDPWKYYVDICSFLNIVPDEKRRDLVANRVNAAKTKKSDFSYSDQVREDWKQDIIRLADLFNHLPTCWLNRR